MVRVVVVLCEQLQQHERSAAAGAVGVGGRGAARPADQYPVLNGTHIGVSPRHQTLIDHPSAMHVQQEAVSRLDRRAAAEQEFRTAYLNAKLARQWATGQPWAALDLAGVALHPEAAAAYQAAYEQVPHFSTLSLPICGARLTCDFTWEPRLSAKPHVEVKSRCCLPGDVQPGAIVDIPDLPILGVGS